MRPSAKHHLLWGSVVVILIAATCLSLEGFYVVYGSIPNGPGVILGFGQGALVIGCELIATEIDSGIHVDIESYESGRFIHRVEVGETGAVFIPVWLIALVPLSLWVVSIWRLKKAV